MTKAELVVKLAESSKITKKQAEQVLAVLAETVKESLQKGEKSVLPGIGALSCVERKARMGRNPQTGADMKIPAKRTAKFSISAALAGALDAGKAKID